MDGRTKILELPGLNEPTDVIMAAGGDDRLAIHERTGLNGYGCSPRPRNAIVYSSATASTLSAAAFGYVEARHYQMQAAADRYGSRQAYADGLELVRNRLTKAYALPPSVDVALGPSGTDQELAVLALALRSHEGRCHNILLGVDEIGSGSLLAAQGRHFAARTALGHEVAKGSAIDGFSTEGTSLTAIEIRDKDGQPRSSEAVTMEIDRAVVQAITDDRRPLVHVIHRSKTDLVVPTWDGLEFLQDRWGEQVDIVVDACQGRIAPSTVRDYLSRGAVVLITGSKFIGGAPFSSAMLVPAHLSDRMKQSTPIPTGLREFFTRDEWPASWTCADTVLRPTPNFGLLLRWESALYELEILNALSEVTLKGAVGVFQATLRRLAQNSSVLDLEAPGSSTTLRVTRNADHPLEQDSIFTLAMTAADSSGRLLDEEDARLLYRALYTDMDPGYRYPPARVVAHVGQPVKCRRLDDDRWQATIRIALGAASLNAIAPLSPELVADRFAADLGRIHAKLEFLLDRLDQVRRLGVVGSY